jgi:hypothetical protein
MPTAAVIALDWLASNAATPAQRDACLAAVPPWQWEGEYWGDLAAECPDRIMPELPRRRANALNLEVGQPRARCKQLAPDGRGLAWLMSGGSPLAYGRCECAACPRAVKQTGGLSGGSAISNGVGDER